MQVPRAEEALALGGRYRVIKRLGSGGMGASVLLAEDERLGRLVALKRLPTSSPEDALARFQREARLGASLNHPNVVSIFDSEADDDALLIVMEYVDGDSLKEELRRGPLAAERAIGVLSQIAAALDYAHSAGVIHRDVKPSNVLIGHDGTAKLADLGIATATDATSITTTNDVIGTLSYIAPERLENAADDPSSDIYSLAAVAFEALSGERAQAGQTPSEIVGTSRARDLRQAWPAAPVGAAEAIRDGLSRDPTRRPSSARELIDRLSGALTGSGAPLPIDPDATRSMAAAAPSPTKKGGWSRGRLAAGAIVAALAAGVAAALLLAGGSGHHKKVAKVKTQVRTVTSKPKPPPPAPLTGTALGSQLNDQGYALIQEGRYSEAIPILRRAVSAFPAGTTDVNYAYALFNLGHALRLAGDPQAAIPILERRLRIADQTGAVAQELASAQQQAGVAPTTGGTAPPGDGASSGGLKPGKSPKPGKGPKTGSGGTGGGD
jgi:eukaryotic-like serine/threonine-protein kinase